ncbi:MAG: TM0106 family RecB-like putative nuclease [candidate division Zixibacteria bacterium]|nr:TM0106 family RecB-like putative nuclease [candidate division Zixibacteria bacterium]
MQKVDGHIYYSPTDLCRHLDCSHWTTLTCSNLVTPLSKDEPSEEGRLVQAKGIQHEKRFLADLKAKGKSVWDLSDMGGTHAERLAATKEAMAVGHEIIYQPFLVRDGFVGLADFLIRIECRSELGSYSYEALDTKLASYTKPFVIIQLCLYSEMLQTLQGTMPCHIHVYLGSGIQESHLVKDFFEYYKHLKRDFLNHVSDHRQAYPEPCDHCERCDFRTLCNTKRIEDDHLSQVANIRKSQIRKLATVDVRTVEALGTSSHNHVKGIGDQTLSRLRQQSQLQLHKRHTDKDKYELLPDTSATKGLRSLPEPDKGDLFFDIEGDPLFPQGLEYLFGICHSKGTEVAFEEFWSHNHREEKQSFEKLITFFMERLKRFPKMHIYHYATYEETAVKRLMCKYATMEAEVDHLLREKVFVDLFKIVRHSLLISEPAYSIKNVERFYLPKRKAEVKTASASIVYYEKYIETGDNKFLVYIRDYNLEDCVSLIGLRDWLGQLKAGAPEVPVEASPPVSFATEENPLQMQLKEFEGALLTGLPESEADYTLQQRLDRLIYDLADYYRREAKPAWWKRFSRQTATSEELIEDGECIGGLELSMVTPPFPEKKSTVVTYISPEQEYKFREGDSGDIAEDLSPAGTIVKLDVKERFLQLKRGNAKGNLPLYLDLIPQGPIGTDTLRNSLWSFIESYIQAKTGVVCPHRSILDLLERKKPTIKGIVSGAPLYTSDTANLRGFLDIVLRMENTYLFIQGPPGTGKTYTASHLILGLMKEAKKVGVSANSHKVIHNLLTAVEQRADESGFTFCGIKKASWSSDDTQFNGKYINNVGTGDDVAAELPGADLVAGTVWLFASIGGQQPFDYLFIDEAGQLSLAHLIAAGTAAKNIILVGDQMQLAQPTQGVHPGDSGKSALEYLLQGRHTIPPEEGILLETTYRMHPNVCGFISEAVYDGRIRSLAGLERQELLTNGALSDKLLRTGITCRFVNHEGSVQRSDEEAEHIKSLYEDILKLRYRDRHDQEHAFTPDNILVVSPYNMQVNNLKRTLGDHARVGTVDKFQGQEAEVVIVSMATSSPDEVSRGIDFLYSQNRLNVSLSRARIASILVMSPQLMNIRCSTVEQMKLANTLCWAKEYASTPQRL